MNEALSTLIAYVGVLIVLSMVVQSLQEALKNFLKLRSKTWERFFYELYTKEFSVGSLRAGSEPPPGRFSVGKYTIGNFEERMKRLKEIVVKTDNGIKSLKDTLFEIVNLDQTDPDAQKQILPLLKEASDAITEITGLKVDSALAIYDRFGEARNTATAFLASLDTHAEIIKKLMTQIGAPLKIDDVQAACRTLFNFLVDNERKISEYRQQIEAKVDSWIAQVEEEYKKNMLAWTLMIGLVFVMAFNADSFSIYKYLSVDSQIRDAVIKKTSETASQTQTAEAATLNQINELISSGKYNEADVLLNVFAGQLQADYRAYEAMEKVKEIDAILTELKTASGEKEKDQKKYLAGLSASAGKLTNLYVGLQRKAVEFRTDKLRSLDLPIGWAWEWPRLSAHWSVPVILQKMGGLLLTWILITFGAPFWNDVLGLLTGLKTAAFRKP